MRKFLIFFILILFAACPAYAELVTTNWTFNIADTGINSWNSNFRQQYFGTSQQISFSYSYDDTDATSGYHVYGDGANGIAEFGGGDDTDLYGVVTGGSGYTVMTDLEFDFGPSFTTYMNSIPDYTTTNANVIRETIANNPAHPTRYISSWADGYYLYMSYTPGDMFDGNFQLGIAEAYYAGNHYQYVFNTSDAQGAIADYSVTYGNPGPAAPVPEPATMLLFGTGLAGLTAMRKRKKA